jgi:hypothetical protein
MVDEKNRDHDRNQKLFPEKSVIDFHVKIDQRSSSANRIAIEKWLWNHKYRRNVKSHPDFDQKIDQRF